MAAGKQDISAPLQHVLSICGLDSCPSLPPGMPVVVALATHDRQSGYVEQIKGMPHFSVPSTEVAKQRTRDLTILRLFKPTFDHYGLSLVDISGFVVALTDTNGYMHLSAVEESNKNFTDALDGMKQILEAGGSTIGLVEHHMRDYPLLFVLLDKNSVLKKLSASTQYSAEDQGTIRLVHQPQPDPALRMLAMADMVLIRAVETRRDYGRTCDVDTGEDKQHDNMTRVVYSHKDIKHTLSGQGVKTFARRSHDLSTPLRRAPIAKDDPTFQNGYYNRFAHIKGTPPPKKRKLDNEATEEAGDHKSYGIQSDHYNESEATEEQDTSDKHDAQVEQVLRTTSAQVPNDEEEAQLHAQLHAELHAELQAHFDAEYDAALIRRYGDDERIRHNCVAM